MVNELEQQHETVRKIQLGENDLRDQLIESCLHDIRRSVRHAIHSFAIDPDDALSIGLEMFNHAIDRYRPDMNVPFIRFAQMVIRNRLIDCGHRQAQVRQAMTFTDCESPDSLPLADRLTDLAASRIGEDLETAEALTLLDAQLHDFALDIDGMVRRFPKHQDTRRLCIKISRQLAADDSLMNRTLQIKRLPVSELSGRCNVPVKTIDKNRASIIFLALLLKSDLTLIQTYLAAFDKEEA